MFSQRPGESALEPRDRDQRGWQPFLDKLSARWTQLGFRNLWQLEQHDFRHHIHQLQLTVPESSLFSLQERQQRRQRSVSELDTALVENLRAGLNKTRSWWARKFQPLPTNLEALRRAYARANLSRQFDQHVQLCERRKLRALHDQSIDLFDQSERQLALRDHVLSARRLFRQRQKRRLGAFDRYYKILRNLPADPIDREVARLAADYEFLGRSRDWFREFEKLVNEAVKPMAGGNAGANEDMLRILQSDFLVLMRNRLPVYFRYYEMRNRCIADKASDHLRNFSYFEQHMIGMHRAGTDTQKCFNDFEAFVKVLEQESHAGESVAHREIDHSTRLEEWTRFKKLHLSPLTDVVGTFNRLRGILVQCPEWIHELRVFRSTMLVHRLMQNQRKNSRQELFDAAEFIRRLAHRIDEEIATDVAYRTLEQELIHEEAFVEQLKTVRENIVMERRSGATSSAKRINELKQGFVRQIWQLRASTEPGSASVTPLFARNRVEHATPGSGLFNRPLVQPKGGEQPGRAPRG